MRILIDRGVRVAARVSACRYMANWPDQGGGGIVLSGRSLLMSGGMALPRCQTPTKRAWNRGQILHLLDSTRLITQVSIDTQMRLHIDHVGWDEYWLAARKTGQHDVMLEQLKSAWASYVESGFRFEKRRGYCFSYFQLLNAALKACLKSQRHTANLETLSRVLAFETFGLSLADQGDQVVAGATSTVRHPGYLLATLKMPTVLDTGEHLPLILPPQTSPGRMYYHYRQHRLSRNSDAGLLTYLAVDQIVRPASFRAVGMLEKAVSGGTDPFAAERAKRLARGGINAYLEFWLREHAGTKNVPIDLIDLGAGSGLVASRLCGEIVNTLAQVGRSPKFRIWLIDLAVSKPIRFFSSRSISQHINSIQVLGADYRQWIDQGESLPVCEGVRLVLMSRFLNNLSDFSIRALDSADALGQPVESLKQAARESCPTSCLAPEGPGPERLVVSNTRMRLANGRTFKQFSLSQYFLGLDLLTKSSSVGTDPHALRQSAFLPVRSFRPNCILTQTGKSLLGTLARLSNLVVIQDADMRPEDVEAHCHATQLDDLTVMDTTRLAGLRGHYSYVIGRRSDSILKSMEGDRIW